MRVFLLINVSKQNTIVGAFVSSVAATRFVRDTDPGDVFTWTVREVPWFDDYGVTAS